MNKQLTAILLISGTCIGAGMIALPISLAKIGVIQSIIVILLTWIFIYYCSLIYVELSLHLKNDNVKSFPLEFSGKKAKLIEDVNIKILSYSALSAYIYGCSSIFQKLIQYDNIFVIETLLMFFIFLLFIFPTNFISKINNIFFIVFIILFLFLLIRVVTCVNFSNIPLFVPHNITVFPSIISLVFTSFGYQLIFYTIKNYCNNDVNMIKKCFFYGSIIPTFVYILWACSTLSVIYNNNSDFFNTMVKDNIDVGDLINELSKCFKFKELQILIYWISIFTLFTSIIGLGLGIIESNYKSLENKINKPRIPAILMTIIPPYLISILIPNAFINILNFAGIILIIISVLLPTYLYFKVKIDKPYIKILNKPTLILCVIIGIFIMIFSLPFFN